MDAFGRQNPTLNLLWFSDTFFQPAEHRYVRIFSGRIFDVNYPV
jgi:hypothetical protein